LAAQACAFVKLPCSLRAAMAIWSPHRRAETTISVDTLILSTDESKARLEKPQAPLLDAARCSLTAKGQRISTPMNYLDLPRFGGSS
jgi:hypothetical protein